MDNGDNTWTVDAADLVGLTITPPENDDTDFTLTTAITFDDNGDQQTFGTVDVTVAH